MTRRQRRKLFGLPGIAPFQITDPLGTYCENCAEPLDRGDWAWWDDRWDSMTCSALCAGKARATEIRRLEEREAQERADAHPYFRHAVQRQQRQPLPDGQQRGLPLWST